MDCALINLQKSKLASSELNLRGYDISLVTEPYAPKGIIRSIWSPNTNLFYKLGLDNPQTCIRVKKCLQAWSIPQFTGRDLTTVCLKIGDLNVWFAVAYLDITLDPWQPELVELAKHCLVNDIPLVVGMDSNAHNMLWGSTETYYQGEGH